MIQLAHPSGNRYPIAPAMKCSAAVPCFKREYGAGETSPRLFGGTIKVLAIAILAVFVLTAFPASAGFWSDVKDGAKKTWEDIKKSGKQVPGKVADDAKESWSAVKDTGDKSGKAVKREVTNAPDDIKNGIDEVKASD